MVEGTYPPIPLPPTAAEGEPVQRFGLRLLMFVVTERVTATLSDEQLTLASYVVPVAMWGRGKDGTDLTVVENVRTAAALIAEALRTRSKLAEVDARQAAGRPTPDTSGVDGSLAPLLPSPDRNPLPPFEYAEVPQRGKSALRKDWLIETAGDKIKF